MNILNSILGIIAALLGNVLIGASPVFLHGASLAVLVLIAIGVLIALPELFFVLVVGIAVFYLVGLIR